MSSAKNVFWLTVQIFFVYGVSVWRDVVTLVINTKTNFSLAASFWRMCLLVSAFILLQWLKLARIHFTTVVSHKNEASKSIKVYFEGKPASHIILGNKFSDGAILNVLVSRRFPTPDLQQRKVFHPLSNSSQRTAHVQITVK